MLAAVDTVTSQQSNKKKYFDNGHNYVLISKPKIIDAKFCEIKKEMSDNFLKFKENKQG